MAANRRLIRGGYVATMDRAIGDLADTDVLVEGDRIAAVARGLDAADAEVIDARGSIVLPGMVDTHRHTWQTLMRGICANWTLDDYFNGMRLTISPAYSAPDVYLGNYLGALDAINSGVTTILDFSHCVNSPEHGDAAIAGLRHAGIRALFGYGFFDSRPVNRAFPDHASRLADFERIATGFPRGGLLTLGAALTEVGVIQWVDTVAEIRKTRDLGGRMVMHTGCVWGSELTNGIKTMHAQDFLRGDQVHVHCNALDDTEWRMLASAGCKVSISPETELNMGMGAPVFGKCAQYGIKPTLSCDIISLNSSDLLTQMRVGLGYARFASNLPINESGAMPKALTYTVRDALEWATINGAEACGLDSEIGSITPGKQADIIIVGNSSFAMRPVHEPLGSVVFQATTRDISTVLIAGKIMKQASKLVGVDLDQLAAEAESAAGEILERVRTSGATLPNVPH
jgi:cytosine/adenosine deaminase-related metal-dependent hydrolase